MVLAVLGGSLSAAPAPESVAILFNTAVPESRRLAALYAELRGIPSANLVGLEMPDAADITRQQYEDAIRNPLKEEFDRRRWWRRVPQENGKLIAVSSQIKVLTVIRGVPLRIRSSRIPAKPAHEPVPPPQPVSGQDLLKTRDDASVDSELSMIGVEGLPLDGVLENKYFQSRQSIANAQLPFLVLTARIDGPGYAVCERMIRDALAAERTGLWGMAYIDLAAKHPQGDGWLETIATHNVTRGIPTVVDRFKETFPGKYPASKVASYYGWYTWNIDGPFADPGFRFQRGAVAVHIHSFSAAQLSDPRKNWCAGLLARGAAVTVGNVYEPYLHLTHDLGLLHQRLLEGHSWVEACWMAMPACSWQAVVLGDPLYQPYLHINGSGTIEPEDKPFRALRAAKLQWPGKEAERIRQLEQAARRTNKGIFLEAVGLEHLAMKRTAEAMVAFQSAKALYPSDANRLRQDLHVVAADRLDGRTAAAVRGLKDALLLYQNLPEAAAAGAWLEILQPPPKPEGPAKPSKPEPVQP